MAVLDANEIFFTAFEPKVQNRFVMYFRDIPSFLVRIAKAPSFTDEEVVLHHINTYRKIRGKREWGTIDLTLYDPIAPSGAQKVMEWARKSYESATGRAGYSDQYKEDVVLNQLGPVGEHVSEWIIKGAFITSADFGDLDWSTGDQVDISLTLTMDYCILNY